MDFLEVKRTFFIVLIILGCSLLFVPVLFVILGWQNLGFVGIDILLLVGGVIAIAVGYLFKFRIERIVQGEAYNILRSHLDNFSRKSYEELKRLLDEPVEVQATSDSGKLYQLRFEGYWKNVEDGDLRVIGTVDPGTKRILTKDWVEFIMTQDGSLVEED